MFFRGYAGLCPENGGCFMENVNKLVGAFPVKMDELHKVCHMFAKLSGAGWAMRSHCLGTDCHVAALLAMTGSGAWCVGARVPGRFAGARRGRAPALRVHDRSRVRWAGCIAETRTVGRGLAPAVSFPEPPRCLQTHRTPKSVIANQRARWCGNPFPCKPQGLRAPAGAQYWPGGYDRPGGRCNAAHCLGTDCHVAALLAMTGLGAGSLGRSC